jgi:PTH1 family peptidyl-tRNA hydrolase
MKQPIELIAGLGNPDPEYLATRHNAGFWMVDAIAAEHGQQFSGNKKLEADTAEVTIAGTRVRLIKPMTWMNESGRALARATAYFKIPAERVLVVYDELDLPPGRAQLRFSGGHAGHNGMRSVIQHIGSEFWRIRIGVGHPGDRSKVTGHVLRRASGTEEDLITGSIRRAIDVLPILIEQGGDIAKNRLHAPDGAVE